MAMPLIVHRTWSQLKWTHYHIIDWVIRVRRVIVTIACIDVERFLNFYYVSHIQMCTQHQKRNIVTR